MKEKVGGRDYYRFGSSRRHKMDCCSCKFMPDTVCLAHYNGKYNSKYKPELSAAIDNAGNCSRYAKSWKAIFLEIKIVLDWGVRFWDVVFHIAERLKLEKLSLFALNKWSHWYLTSFNRRNR